MIDWFIGWRKDRKNLKSLDMNKTTEKILLSPINLLAWMSHNPAEVFIIAVYICSLLTFFIDIKSPTMIGWMCAFCSMIMLYIVKRREKKEASKLYNIFGLIILIVGVIALFVIGNKQYKDYYSPMEKFLCVYMGAFGGMILGGFMFGMIESERDKRNLERKIENKKILAKKSIPENASAFVSSEKKIPIRSCNGDKIIGYIDKAEYNELIYKHTIKDNEQKQ